MAQLFTNNASSTLASGITDTATSMTVATGHGARFPAITGADYFLVTLEKVDGTREIVKVTARSGDVLSGLVRAQEGTTAVAFSTGDVVELRVTAGLMSQVAQSSLNVIGAMQEITSVTTVAGQTSVLFTSIPDGYRDLEVRIHGRSANAVLGQGVLLRFNSDTAANYRWRWDVSIGGQSSNSDTAIQLGEIAGTTADGTYVSEMTVTIPAYRSAFEKATSTVNAFRVANLANDSTAGQGAGYWDSSAAVTSVEILMEAGAFATGSVITLYGVGGTSVAQALSATPAAQIYAGAMREIATVTTTGSQASVTFSGIPSTYRDLLVVVNGRGTTAATLETLNVRFNGDSSAIYDSFVQNREGYGVRTRINQTSAEVGNVEAATGPTAAAARIEMRIGSYAGTLYRKAFLVNQTLKTAEATASFYHQFSSGWWRSTSAITQVELFLSAGGFVDGSTVTLYGIGGEVGGAALNPIYTKYDPFCPPLNPSSLNDEFDVEGSGTPSGWTAVGAAATLLTRRGQLVFTSPANAGFNTQIIEKVLPAGPFSIATRLSIRSAYRYVNSGLVVRNSTSGKSIRWGHYLEGASATVAYFNDYRLAYSRWTALDTRSTIDTVVLGAHETVWYLMTCDGTTLKSLFSFDGVQWFEYASEAVATHFSGGDLPNRVGVFGLCENTSFGGSRTYDFFRHFSTATDDIGRNIGVGSDGTVVSTLPLLLHGQVI
jgi:hypothetical protein